MRRRGLILVVCLLLGIILMVMGMALMSQKALEYRGASRTAASVQALALARAGLEDARIKLDQDGEFPPLVGDQKVFSYTEQVTNGALLVGSYTVTVDLHLAEPTYYIIRITSVGTSGPMTDPLARRKLYAELDVAPRDRLSPADPNPTLYEFLLVEDLGGL
ncbi:MAG: hypothetical protein AB1758_30160 [Candidatus Eremiobacterota bacterium]